MDRPCDGKLPVVLKRMVAFPRILTLVVLILVLVACGVVQPTPTPTSMLTYTPVSTPAQMLTSTHGDRTQDISPSAPALDSIAVPYDHDALTPVGAAHSCNLMDTPYDALMTSTTPFGETRAEIRYSMSDEHIVQMTTDHEGVLFGKGEMIIKDRTMYSRESTPGNAEVYGQWLVHGTNVPQSLSLPCLDPGSFEEGATNSSDEPHFTSEVFLSEEEGAMRNEYWADSAGRPTRARRTLFPPEYDGVSNTETIIIEFTYSGYGEPNIIAAPCAGAAPTEADNPSLMRDCLNLLGLKDTLRGTAALNWSLDTALTNWEGITTGGTPARVTRLELPNEGLSGAIPFNLANLDGLPELTHLDLSNNSLTGGIPQELSRLENLESLKLSGNSFTGCIPVTLMNVGTNDLSSVGLLYCPSPPEGLTVGTPEEFSVPLSWEAAPNTARYRVWYGIRGSGVSTVDDDTITSTSHTVDELACGSEYEFRVSAHGDGVTNAAEWSGRSVALTASTTECISP